VHVRKHLAREPGEPMASRRRWGGGTCREVQGRTPMKDGHAHALATIESGQKSLTPAQTGGHSIGNACRHSDRRCTPVSRVRAERPAPRDCCPAPPTERPRSF
jgi:hypothetical protein